MKKKSIAWRERLMPTTTVRQARFQIYQATFSPKLITRAVDTIYGRGTITGRLGMSHAMLMESIFYHALIRKDMENGGLSLLIDLHDIRRTMSCARGKDRRYSQQRIVDLAADLKAATLILSIDGLPGVTGVLNSLLPHPTATRANPVTKRQRPMYVAEVTPAYRTWIDHDLHLHYDPAPLAHVRHAISAAVARWVLTHKDEPRGGWLINTVIQAVGGDTTGVSGRHRRRELHLDADLLRDEVGIEVTGDRIHIRPRACSPGPGAQGGRAVYTRERAVQTRDVRCIPGSVQCIPAEAGVFQESLTGGSQE